MNICIIGSGLTALALAKNLINKKINVHIYERKKKSVLFLNRTIGITKNNLEFLNKDITHFPKKNVWPIKKIEIYSSKLKNEKILDFEKKKYDLFYMIQNEKFYKHIHTALIKSKFFKKKKIINENTYNKLLNEKKYDLIVNCELNNPISKKYFSKRINKEYYNLAYVTVLKHAKLDNHKAIQVFTKFGPIAYLPISNTETSIVCSLDTKNIRYSNDEVINLIKKYNPKLKIKEISKLSNFKLNSSNLRNYTYKNILAFGDLLHKIHPLAGQGFNMTIRDIRTLSEIIQNKIDLGLQLDSIILDEFQKKNKHINSIFLNGVDIIYEIFSLDKNISNNNFMKILKRFGKNQVFTEAFMKIADKGFSNY